jgi:serine protease AprX
MIHRLVSQYSANWRKRLNLLLVVALMLPLMAVTPAHAPSVGRAQRVQPILLQMAAEQPEARVSVIVQKTVKDTSVENLVTGLGGQVTKDLSIIHAFAAEVPGKAVPELAWARGVRWVSLDAPVQQALSSDTHVFITWATQFGANGTTCLNPANMYDSALGANGTFGSCNDNDSYWRGFSAQVTPGDAITKVEVVLYAYASTALSASDVIGLSFWNAGKVVGNWTTVDPTLFAARVGAANAGPVYVDVTSSRTSWLWSDLDTLELEVDQNRFDTGHYLYYDAIGLRVTSAPGSGTTGDTGGGTSRLATIAPSLQVGVAGDTGGDTSRLAKIDTGQQVNVYNQVIRASQLWNSTSKLQGKGVTVAMVDSGVYKTQDLDMRVRANVNFNPAFHDSADRFGHGTFVAGIVAGNGSQSAGKYIGVAPRVDILNVRVSDDQGMSTESDVVNALQWVLNNKSKYNIRVVNLSLNSAVAQSYNTSPLDAAVEILWFNGIVGVVSAGNNGTATLFPPANDPFVITVGATDDKGTVSTGDDLVAAFSAYGTTESRFAKPDLVAPGRAIIGLLPENGKLKIGQEHPSNRVDGTYFKMSGTSVAAPMVSGAVALLLQDEPNLNPDQVKYRLMATANKKWTGYSAAKAGAGYLDIYAAVHGTTTQTANTGTKASDFLSTGDPPVSQIWGSAQWGSAQWGSAQWGSAQWGSAQWGSAQWGSDYWGP